MENVEGIISPPALAAFFDRFGWRTELSNIVRLNVLAALTCEGHAPFGVFEAFEKQY